MYRIVGSGPEISPRIEYISEDSGRARAEARALPNVTIGRSLPLDRWRGRVPPVPFIERELLRHSHSMVAGGFDVTSSTTRLTSRTSFVMRFEIFASTSYGRRVQSAVIASSDDTGRSTTGWP